MKVRKSEVVTIRLDEETHQRLRSLQPHLSEPARDATFSDVFRKVLILGLGVVDEGGPDVLCNVVDRPEPTEVGNDSEGTI